MPDLSVFEQYETYDLSAANDYEEIKVPEGARQALVIRRDADCDLSTRRGGPLLDAARNTMIGVGEGFEADAYLYLSNDAANAGDEIVIAWLTGRRLRQGVDRFSPNLRLPQPTVLGVRDDVVVSADETVTVFTGIPVAAFDEVTWAVVEGITGGDANSELTLEIELFDSDGNSLGTTTEGRHDTTGWPRSVSASDPDMHTAEARIKEESTAVNGAAAADVTFLQLRLIGSYN